MLKKMILAILLATNGTVAFAAQQERVTTENETEQTTEQKETYVQRSKQALKTYFVRNTKTKTRLNIAAKTAALGTILGGYVLLCQAKTSTQINRDLFLYSIFWTCEPITKKMICFTTGLLCLFTGIRELTNY